MSRRGEAQRRKESGIVAISSGRNRWFAARITRAILRRKAGDVFTSEDLRRSTRPESHARVIAVWRRA
jgi:hypothetical protein